jgi:putative ABC transport system ATP-binding protein
MSLITLDKVTKSFGKGHAKTTVLKGVSLQIEAGEFVAIMGASGSGKSTLMNILGLLDRADSGSYELDGTNVHSLKDKHLAHLRRAKIGFVFQSFNLLGRLNVAANVQLPMIYQRLNRAQRKSRSQKLLKAVGLSQRAKYRPTQLSGGETQRVAIARALANSPSLILADEPTGNLDSVNGRKIMDLVSQLHKQGNTVILVTHDDKVAKRANRIITIKDGRVSQGAHK